MFTIQKIGSINHQAKASLFKEQRLIFNEVTKVADIGNIGDKFEKEVEKKTDIKDANDKLDKMEIDGKAIDLTDKDGELDAKNFNSVLDKLRTTAKEVISSTYEQLGGFKKGSDQMQEKVAVFMEGLKGKEPVFNEKELTKDQIQKTFQSYLAVFDKFNTAAVGKNILNKKEKIKVKDDKLIATGVDQEKAVTWFKDNGYTFVESTTKGTDIKFPDGQVNTMEAGVVDFWPVYEQDGKTVKFVVTLDGNGDAAQRFTESTSRFIDNANNRLNIVGNPKNVVDVQNGINGRSFERSAGVLVGLTGALLAAIIGKFGFKSMSELTADTSDEGNKALAAVEKVGADYKEKKVVPEKIETQQNISALFKDFPEDKPAQATRIGEIARALESQKVEGKLPEGMSDEIIKNIEEKVLDGKFEDGKIKNVKVENGEIILEFNDSTELEDLTLQNDLEAPVVLDADKGLFATLTPDVKTLEGIKKALIQGEVFTETVAEVKAEVASVSVVSNVSAIEEIIIPVEKITVEAVAPQESTEELVNITLTPGILTDKVGEAVDGNGNGWLVNSNGRLRVPMLKGKTITDLTKINLQEITEINVPASSNIIILPSYFSGKITFNKKTQGIQVDGKLLNIPNGGVSAEKNGDAAWVFKGEDGKEVKIKEEAKEKVSPVLKNTIKGFNLDSITEIPKEAKGKFGNLDVWKNEVKTLDNNLTKNGVSDEIKKNWNKHLGKEIFPVAP